MLYLTSSNIWKVIIKQKKYKTLPLLNFYIFAFLTVSLRLIYIIWCWTRSRFIYNINFNQVIAKLCIGVVQDWISFELTIRVRNARLSTTSSP